MEPLNEAILFSVFTRRIKKIRGIHNEIRSLLSLWLATVWLYIPRSTIQLRYI